MTKIIISENQFNELTKKLKEEQCILEWDLYHQMMEKKYGKRKIDTEYKYLRKK